MTVTILSLAARGAEEIAATFEIRSGEHSQKESFLISAALVADLRLCRGETDRDCFDAVSHGAAVWHAVKKGLYLLGYGACSERGLCRKLIQKGIEKEIAEEAVAQLCRDGYLDPVSDALREAERCVAKLWGKRRIAAALFAKGYSDGIVRDAMNSLEDQGVDYTELCAERIRRTGSVLPADPMERRKLVSSLERCGFSHAEIREAFDRIADEEKE